MACREYDLEKQQVVMAKAWVSELTHVTSDLISKFSSLKNNAHLVGLY